MRAVIPEIPEEPVHPAVIIEFLIPHKKIAIFKFMLFYMWLRYHTINVRIIRKI